MAISIGNSTPAQVALQDLLGNPATSTGSGVPSGAAPTATDAASVAGGASSSDQISAHAGLVALASGTPSGETGGLVNSDLDGEGARLQALQLQQQLAGQSASIANQAPQALLALLR